MRAHESANVNKQLPDVTSLTPVNINLEDFRRAAESAGIHRHKPQHSPSNGSGRQRVKPISS